MRHIPGRNIDSMYSYEWAVARTDQTCSTHRTPACSCTVSVLCSAAVRRATAGPRLFYPWSVSGLSRRIQRFDCLRIQLIVLVHGSVGTWILVFNCDLKGCIDYFRQQNISHLGSLMCFHNSLFHCIFIESEVTIYDFLVTLVEFFAIYSDCWTVAKSAPDRVCWSKCTFFAQVFCEAGCLDWRWPVVGGHIIPGAH